LPPVPSYDFLIQESSLRQAVTVSIPVDIADALDAVVTQAR